MYNNLIRLKRNFSIKKIEKSNWVSLSCFVLKISFDYSINHYFYDLKWLPFLSI